MLDSGLAFHLIHHPDNDYHLLMACAFAHAIGYHQEGANAEWTTYH